jgi:hypothetical protein
MNGKIITSLWFGTNLNGGSQVCPISAIRLDKQHKQYVTIFRILANTRNVCLAKRYRNTNPLGSIEIRFRYWWKKLFQINIKYCNFIQAYSTYEGHAVA